MASTVRVDSEMVGGVARFWRVLREEMRAAEGREEVADLDGAAAFLYDDRRLGRKVTPRQRAKIRQFKAEVNRKTAGMPFRLDTPRGPLFVLLPLWRYAGCSGPYMGPDDQTTTKPRPRPTWNGNWRRPFVHSGRGPSALAA